MRYIVKTSAFCLLAFSAITHAAEPGPINAVAAFRFGSDWAQVGESQHVQLLDIDPAPDYFDTTNSTSYRPVFGGFFGVEVPFFDFPHMRWQTGVAYYQTDKLETEGIEYFFSLPDFGNKTYSYRVKNQRWLFENKFLYGFHPRLSAYALGGLGVAFNTASDYHEASIDGTTPATGIFASDDMGSFSYAMGFGFEGQIIQNIRLSLGYQFSDLGKVSLGNYNNGNTTDTLSFSTMPTQEIIMQLSLVF